MLGCLVRVGFEGINGRRKRAKRLYGESFARWSIKKIYDFFEQKLTTVSVTTFGVNPSAWKGATILHWWLIIKSLLDVNSLS